MGLIDRTLRRLMPGGNAWRGRGNLALVLEGLAGQIEAARAFLDAAQTESIPKTASVTLQDWFRALGMYYEPGRTDDQRRAAADLAYTSAGGQSLEYLTDQLQKEYPHVWIEEGATDASGVAGDAVSGESVTSAYYNFSFNFSVKGDVFTVRDYYRVVSIVQRLAPLHLEPEFFIRILNELDIARTGIAVTGRARTGKGP